MQAYHPDLCAASNASTPPRRQDRPTTRLNRYEGVKQEPYIVEAARILLDAPNNLGFQLWVKAALEEGYFDCNAPGMTAGDLACAMLTQRLVELKRIRAARLAHPERGDEMDCP